MLFVGDDWAEDHHDVEVVDEAGRRLARRRFDEGVAGMAALHAVIANHLPEDAESSDVVVGIGIRPPARNPTVGMRTCWRNWSAWTERIIGKSPAIPISLRR